MKDVKVINEYCYILKRWVYIWSGYIKGVFVIRFFFKYGYFFFFVSMDMKVKIWDVYGSGKCM